MKLNNGGRLVLLHHHDTQLFHSLFSAYLLLLLLLLLLFYIFFFSFIYNFITCFKLETDHTVSCIFHWIFWHIPIWIKAMKSGYNYENNIPSYVSYLWVLTLRSQFGIGTDWPITTLNYDSTTMKASSTPIVETNIHFIWSKIERPLVFQSFSAFS